MMPSVLKICSDFKSRVVYSSLKKEICTHHGDLLQHASKHVEKIQDKHKRKSKPFSSTRLTDISFTVSKSSTVNQKAQLQLT